MKKVINGKLFDTEKAEIICNYSYGYSNDFRHKYEALYKSPSSQFFIEYEGGPSSEYGEYDGNLKYGTRGIKVISDDEAKLFVEANGEYEDYKLAFGEPELG